MSPRTSTRLRFFKRRHELFGDARDLFFVELLHRKEQSLRPSGIFSVSQSVVCVRKGNLLLRITAISKAGSYSRIASLEREQLLFSTILETRAKGTIDRAPELPASQPPPRRFARTKRTIKRQHDTFFSAVSGEGSKCPSSFLSHPNGRKSIFLNLPEWKKMCPSSETRCTLASSCRPPPPTGSLRPAAGAVGSPRSRPSCHLRSRSCSLVE